MKDLYAAFIADGYLYGATQNSYGADRSYWLGVSHEEGFCIVLIKDVPDDVVSKLENEVFDDGYDAASAVASFTQIVMHEAPNRIRCGENAGAESCRCGWAIDNSVRCNPLYTEELE